MPDTYLDMSLFRPSGYENVTVADSATPTKPTEEQLRAWTLGAVGPLTATRKMQLPLTRGYQATVANLSSGGWPLEVGGATGNVVTLAPDEVATVVTDGVNYGRTATGAPARVKTLNVPITTYTDTNLTLDQANADALIVTGGTDGGGYSLAFPVGFSRPANDAISIYEATGTGFSIVLGGDTWNLPGWGTMTIRWYAGGPPTAFVYTPVIGSAGDVSHVMLGNGLAGNVPAVALPAPAAGSKGGVALPASATGLAYMDWGGFGTAGVAAIANGNADQTLSTGQASNFVLIFSGALTAYRYITLPLTGGRSWWVINNCSGGFGLNFRGATGGYATIGSGAKGMICTDGIAFFA
jgi:hypothetical protein